MGFFEGVAKGGLLGMLYSVVAAPPFTLMLGPVRSLRDLGDIFGMTGFIGLCAVPAGALVGAAAVVTRAYRPGQLWRAQLAMLGAYVLSGLWFLGGLFRMPASEVWELTVSYARVFIPLGVLATWVVVQWLRAGERRVRSAA